MLYGHYAEEGLGKKNNTLCLDTGCVFGGNLSAYRYPEGEIVSIPAKRAHLTRDQGLKAAENSD